MVYGYYGMGQGKTSALNGLILRAYGTNKNILVIRFFKSDKWKQSEDKAFEKLGIKIIYFQECTGFIWNENKRDTILNNATNGLEWLINNYENYDFLFLDEILDLVTNKVLTSEQFKELITKISKDKNVFISGHYMDETIKSCIDVLTHMEKIKHHYDNGVLAIRGIDY